MTRRCTCPHAYPICACFEGLSGPELLRRSNLLSSLAGWPNMRLVTPESIAAVIVEFGRPAPPAWLALPRIRPALFGEAPTPPAGCGCGQGLA
jgi:hypothetical protein